MFRSLVFFLALSLPWVASADAIRPFDGACPPGLESAIRNHREVCVPRACMGNGDCPEGSACGSLFECWARRPAPGADVDGPTIETSVGPCDAERHCEEGLCRERRQCEPTEPTAAWDPAARRWTETPYVAPSSTCAAGPAGEGTVAAFSVIFAVAWLARRRR